MCGWRGPAISEESLLDFYNFVKQERDFFTIMSNKVVKKVVLLPGHSHRDGGAGVVAGRYKGKSEYELARLYLPLLADALRGLGYDVCITCREDAGGTTPSCSAKAANATGADLALEFHFNAATATATGAEVMYWGKSATGKRFAEALGERVAARLGVRHRGALAVPTLENRGTEAFRQSRMPFFMVEFCFAGSNPADAEKLCAAVAAPDWEPWLAGAVDAAINEAFGVTSDK